MNDKIYIRKDFPMKSKFKLAKEAFQFEGKMPLRQAIPLGLQHVLAMFVGNLTPLLIITSACGLTGGEFAELQVALLQNSMLLQTDFHKIPALHECVFTFFLFYNAITVSRKSGTKNRPAK